MPTIRGGGQVNRGGYHNQQDMEKTERPAFARDDISSAYAGDENAEKWERESDKKGHSSYVKSRKTEKSKTRTPER